MTDAHKNFAYSTVATAPSPATTGTSLVVAAGDGALFPAVPFNVTIWPAGVPRALATNAEVARVTAIASDTFTIVRAQEGSSARTVVVGDQIAATITAKTLTDAELVNYVLGADVLVPADHEFVAEDLVEVPSGNVLELAAGNSILYPGDGQGGNVLLTGSRMSGTLQTPYLQAKGKPWFDVRAFGAVADGVTNDGPAIQAAIDTCYQQGGGVVYLPATSTSFLYLTNQQLIVRPKVILRGDGERSTGILAGGSFPTSTYVVQIGDATTTAIAFATRVENLYIDCNNISGSGGVYSALAEEHAGVFGCMVMNYRAYGIKYDFVDGSHNCQNCEIRDVELFPSTSGSSGGISAIIANRGVIAGVSITSSGGTHTDGVLVNNSNGVRIMDIQGAGQTDLVHVTGSSNAYIASIYGVSGGTNVVHLGSGSQDMVVNTVGRGSYTNSLTDDFTGLSWTDPSIRLYTTTEQIVGAARVTQNTGDPEGNVTARVGSFYMRGSLVAGATPLNFKASGTGNTGWKRVLYDAYPSEWISSKSEVFANASQLFVADVYEVGSNNVTELTNPDGLLCVDSPLDAVLRAGGTMFGELVAPDVSVSGLPGAISGARFVGATASGAPTTGTFRAGDFVVDQSGSMWVCTVAGTPGTWVQVGGAGMTGTNGSQALGSDVACATANTFADGPATPSIGASGQKFLISGHLTILCGTTLTKYTVKLWQGTTTIAETEVSMAASSMTSVHLSGVRPMSGAETWKMSAAPLASTTGGLIKAAAVDNSAGNFGSVINYLRLA